MDSRVDKMDGRVIVYGGFICVLALALSACNWHLKAVCRPGANCSIEGGIDGTIGAMSVAEMTAATGGVDLSTMYIDTTGTTYAIAASGPISLTVTNSAGTVLGTNTFTYVKSGSQVLFQNRSAVEAWLNGYSATGAAVTYTIDEGPAALGQQTIANAQYYQGVKQSSVVQSFTNCGKAGVHLPHPPIGCN